VADTAEVVVPKPVVYTPPSRTDIEELSKALAEDGIVEKPVEPPPAPAPVEPPKAEVKAEPPKVEAEEPPAIVKIARKQAEFRKEVEQYKPLLEVLQRAKSKQISPADALTALGFTHSEYVDAVLAKGGAPAEEPAKAEAPKRSLDPEIEELRKFKAQYEAEKAQTARQQALTGIEAAVKKGGDKFKHLAALEKWDMVESTIINHYNQTGALPGDTFEESVLLAAEVVEGALKQEAQKWQKLYGAPLTSGTAPATVQTQKAPEQTPSTGNVAGNRTLTNANTTAPAAVVPNPKTRAEILAAIARGEDIE
jgi:hypothetical protein